MYLIATIYDFSKKKNQKKPTICKLIYYFVYFANKFCIVNVKMYERYNSCVYDIKLLRVFLMWYKEKSIYEPRNFSYDRKDKKLSWRQARNKCSLLYYTK